MGARGLEIRVLGELEVLSAGRVLALPTSRKTRALLGYLAAKGQAERRTRLCDLLWDGPDDPRAALRWSLSRLRPLLNVPGTERLRADREHVALSLQGSVLDLAALRRELGAGSPARASTEALRRAADLFRGDFLEGLELPDCPRYHEWCQAERNELRRLRLAILAALVEREQDADACVQYARQRIAIDPYDERAHADLVRLLARLGRAEEALDQYDQCRRLLERDLGVRASSALEAARAEVRSRASAVPKVARAPSAAAAPEAPSAAAALPLVGRAAELARLDAMADAASRQGAPAVALVTGEPGIGKSRLLAELARRTRAAGGCVLSARAFEVEMVRPYGLWIDAFRALEGWAPPWPAELSALVPDLAPARGTPPVADRTSLFEAARGTVIELAKRAGRLAIVFDDIQWIDEASATLLHLVTRAPAGILVACAARPGEIDDNPAALRLVRALRGQDRLARVELGALDREGTAQLVRALGRSVDASRVYSESGGNPLFAIELARSQSRGEGTFPESLRAIVADRIDQLDAGARELLLFAAAFGKSFRAELLGAVAGVAEPELSPALQGLERRGFLALAQRTPASEYDFVHDVIRQGAYLLSSEVRRCAVHRRMARVLGDAAASDPDLARDVAHHAALGGDAGLAARWSLAAAERCQSVFANAEAIAIAERGLRHAATLPREKGLALEVGLLKVEVCSGAGTRRRAELEGALMRVATEAQHAGASAEAAEALYALSILHHEGGNFPGAEASILGAAAASRAADARTKVRSLANAGRCLAQIERDMVQANAMLSEAEALARREGLDVSEIEWGLGVVRHFMGEHDAAVASLEHALVMLRRERDHWAECDCLTRLVVVAVETGRFEVALGLCRELAAVAAKMGEGSERMAAAALAALARFALGEAGARERVAAAIDALREMDAKGLLAYALTFAAEIEITQGDATAALAHCEEALAAAGAVGRRSLTALAQATMARILFARGERPRALSYLEKGCRDLGTPLALSARAKAALDKAGKLLGVSISTLVPTRAQTVAE